MPERANELFEVNETGTWDLYAVILFSVITLIIVFLFDKDVSFKLIGIPLILFFFGYSIFSYISIGKEISGIDRICYSIFLSILITLLIYSSMTVKRMSCETIMRPALSSLVTLTIIFSILSIYKRFKSEGLFIPKLSSTSPEEHVKSYKVFTGALAILLVAAYLAIIPLVLIPKFGLDIIGLTSLSMADSQNSSEIKNVLNSAGFKTKSYQFTESSHSRAQISGFKSSISLILGTGRTQIQEGESASFTLSVLGTLRAVPVEIRVNSTTVKTISVENVTGFNLTFTRAGIYNVSAYFPGDLSYEPAKSNMIVIEVLGSGHSTSTPLDPIFMKLGLVEIARSSFCFSVLFIQISVVGALILFRCLLRVVNVRKCYKEEQNTSRRIRRGNVSAKNTNSIRTAYRNLFNLLVINYGLQRSLTPRELLKILKAEPFYVRLEEITLLHEKAVYCRAGLTENERKKCFSLIRDVMKDVHSRFGGEKGHYAGIGIPGKTKKAV